MKKMIRGLFLLLLILGMLSGCSSIHGAAMDGDIDAMKRLLDQGEDVNKIGGYNAGQVAIGTIFPPAGLIMLLTWSYDNNDTVLNYAVGKCQIEASRFLLERGADPNISCNACAQHRRGGLSLHQAVLEEYYNKNCDGMTLVQLLLDYGAYDMEAIRFAQENKMPEMVRLIQEGREKYENKKRAKDLKAKTSAKRNALRTLDPTRSALEEKAGDDAKSRADEALAHYIKALNASPADGDNDVRLREKIIRLALKMDRWPSIPDKAQEHSDRAQTFMKKAEGAEGYERAIAELDAGLLIAPWWAEAYFNLGLLLEKVGDYDGAIGSFKLYLLAAPDAKDAGAVKKKIIEIEVSREMAKGR